MMPPDWIRLRALFEGTLACPPEARGAYLDEHVDGDDGLRRELESLLAAHEAADGFLAGAPFDPGAHDVTAALTTNASHMPANRLSGGSHLGPFEILEPIGAGGMGEVYRARDTRLDRFVAIKVLSPDLDMAPGGRERFEREARAISRLSHPHICTIHDIGSAQIDRTAVPFLVMELLDGESLAARLSRGPLPLGEALTHALAIAEALEAAHHQGVVHRDVKPANVMVTASGVKLLDFGLAQLRGTGDRGAAGAADGSLTNTGMVFGTVPYMAPEQLRGERADARTDVFALGALLHEMVTGCRPFTADSQAGLIAAILEHDTPPVSARQPRAPAHLDHVVRKCLAKGPALRWQTASDLRAELQRAIEEVRGARPTASKRSMRIAVPALAMLAGVIWALWPASDGALPEPSLGPLTAFHGDEGYPAFSPDGIQVAFAWNGEGRDNADIYIKRIDADTPLRLTTDPADDIAPAWSHDGSRIAFIRSVGEQASIYVTAPVPGAERKLADYVPSWVGYPSFSTRNHSAAWSHDSRWVIVAARIPAERPNAILAVPAGGGEPLVMLSVAVDEGEYRFPTVSPDGRSLAYAFCRGQGCDVFVTALGADMISRGEPRRLTRQSAQSAAPIFGIAWAADGRSLVYGSWVGMLNLWRVPTSGAEPKRLELGLGGLRPDISRAGNRLAYARLRVDSDIWKFEAGAGPVPVASSSLLDIDAHLAPDGTRLALASERSGRREIWTASVDGTGAVRLTDSAGGGIKGTPRWSPDGRWLAYDEREENGRFGIHVIEAAGGSPRRLTDDGIVPSWSRDGAWIYFGSSRSGTNQIWRVPASGGDAEQFTDAGGYSAWESWDGTLVYYNRGGGLYARAVTGGAEQEVLPPTTGVSRNFFPAAQGIYYAVNTDAARPNAWEIRLLDVATARSETLYRFESLGLSQGLSVSPDGTTVLFSGLSPSKNADLMLVENFR
jgi:eukaryotic-like serine/threonine-protein kinase